MQTTSRAQRLIRPLRDFLEKEASAGVLVVAAAVVALIWANSPLSTEYHDLFGTEIVLDIGGRELALTLKEWISDAVMVLFFFIVGLEIKREMTQGELRDPRQAALPVIAALGGMIVPALIFTAFNGGTEASDGWGIPMATDIAIVVGVVSLLGSRAPSWLSLFLLTLAIADDLGAIIVIAVFYSEGVSLAWLALAVATLVVARLIRSRVHVIGPYVALGLICWFSLHEAHIHPTLAGVAFGLLAPVVPRTDPELVDATELTEERTAASAAVVASRARSTVSVVEWLEHRLHPYTAFIIVPLFALANAGITVQTDALGDIATSRVTWGVILGLVVGKCVGIASFTLIAVRLGIATLPRGVTSRYVIAAGALGGIGFTVSLFVTELAFGEGEFGRDARLGVLVASAIAAVVGTLIALPGRVEPHADDLDPDVTEAVRSPARR